jgi:hypothetical protein
MVWAGGKSPGYLIGGLSLRSPDVDLLPRLTILINIESVLMSQKSHTVVQFVLLDEYEVRAEGRLVLPVGWRDEHTHFGTFDAASCADSGRLRNESHSTELQPGAGDRKSTLLIHHGNSVSLTIPYKADSHIFEFLDESLCIGWDHKPNSHNYRGGA